MEKNWHKFCDIIFGSVINAGSKTERPVSITRPFLVFLQEHSEGKGIQKAIKNLPICVCMGGCASVCLSICMSVCLSVYLSVCLSIFKSWITFDGMKGSWRNFQDQSNSAQVIFGRGSQISQPQGYGPSFIVFVSETTR